MYHGIIGTITNYITRTFLFHKCNCMRKCIILSNNNNNINNLYISNVVVMSLWYITYYKHRTTRTTTTRTNFCFSIMAPTRKASSSSFQKMVLTPMSQNPKRSLVPKPKKKKKQQKKLRKRTKKTVSWKKL